MRAVWVAAAVLLAGCAGETGDNEPAAFQNLEASSKTGVIRGIVVDETITPVPNANVKLTPGDKATVSDADGAFAYADLDPGVYFLTVSAPYYTTVQASTEVKAGDDKPPIVRVRIQALPKPIPAIQALEWRFFMDGSVMTPAGGVVAGGFLGMGSFGASLDIAANATWVQSELVWEAEQPLASDVRMYSGIYGADGELDDARTSGTSPLVQAFSNSTLTRQAERVAYTLFIDYGTYPVGATIGQELNLYVHVFQHFVPTEGWQFGRDGPHAVPPPP